ncbi:tail tubular protein A [Aeromonas phage JELG-KS1]|uniref:Tail tubular protein A n=1 Tax=Aeromonas phage JELG-KS1 TaxID=2951233 RepID=A0A9E7NN78_9CAUD|nr:tail tubular protein A [Aeromonas phage JELG-KS1]
MSTMDANWSYQAELGAVNEILAAIGESPVSTLEGDINTDVVSARRILHKINRREQSKGWSFNIDEEAVLRPDTYSGLIPYMPNYLRVIGSDGTPYSNRGGALYDRTNRTDRFTSPVTVQLVSLAEFDEMPEVFKALVIAKAAKEFNMSFFGATEIDTVLANDIIELTQSLMEFEMDYGSFNAFTDDPFISGAVGR